MTGYFKDTGRDSFGMKEAVKIIAACAKRNGGVIVFSPAEAALPPHTVTIDSEDGSLIIRYRECTAEEIAHHEEIARQEAAKQGKPS